MRSVPPVWRWGVGGGLSEIEGGHRNRVFLMAGSGVRMVFKSTRRCEAAIDWLGPVLDLAERSGFVVPRPVRSQQGRLVEDGWTAEPFMEGMPVRAGEVAGLWPRLRAFHLAGAGLSQRPGFSAADDLQIAESGGDVDLAAMPFAVRVACREAWLPLNGSAKGALHGDFHAGNLLWSPQGQPVLLDWDEARVDHGAFEGAVDDGPVSRSVAVRARLAWEVAVCWKIEPDRAQALAVQLRSSVL